MRVTLLAITIGIATVGAISAAQEPRPAFDVVSIKPAGPGAPPLAIASVSSFRDSGQFRAPGITAQRLIAAAFPDDGTPRRVGLIAGGPDWFATAQFEIVARTDGPVPAGERAARLPALPRALLEDRFAFRSHLEMRPTPIYALVPARPDGRLGPGLHPATTDCPPPPGGVSLPVPTPPAGTAAP
jgi:uncharacterized protein (TIGR03435 family)